MPMVDVQSTSTGTKSEVVQFLVYSFQLPYSTHRLGRHSQKPSYQQVDGNKQIQSILKITAKPHHTK